MPVATNLFLPILASTQKKVERWLDSCLPSAESSPGKLHEAMRYAVLGGGKRLRPALVLLSSDAYGGREDDARPAACAVELVHAYSLVHDDLPCMDDGELRRGKPCVHQVYGEANAVLVGDALLTLAFRVLASGQSCVQVLAEAAGSLGMVGGQVEDLAAEGKVPDRKTVERIHRLKTGALISASIEMGAVCAGAGAEERSRLRDFGRELGLAFQIVDDLLDATGDPGKLGKASGQDAAEKKMTYPACWGLEGARGQARLAVERAKERAGMLGTPKKEPFLHLAEFVLQRVS